MRIPNAERYCLKIPPAATRTAVSRAEALDYCRWLARAGYLRDLGEEKFRFVPARNTGIKAPQIVRVTQVYDPNIDQLVARGPFTGRDDE